MPRLKADETAIPINRGYILVCNVTIPFEQFGTEGLTQRVFRFLNGEFLQSGPVKFEITGTYTLRHKRTNQLRTWTGSFSPKRDFALTELLDFEETNFTRHLERFLNIDYLIPRCCEIVPDSDWVFHSVTALIVNAQAVVSLNSATITRRNIIDVSRGKKRRHVTFDLP